MDPACLAYGFRRHFTFRRSAGSAYVRFAYEKCISKWLPTNIFHHKPEAHQAQKRAGSLYLCFAGAPIKMQ